jgi:hypothetical protein
LPQTFDGGQQTPFMQVVPGGQHDETPPLPAIALQICPVGQQTPAKQVVPAGQHCVTVPPATHVGHPKHNCEVGQQKSPTHCVPGGQQTGCAPAAALPPQTAVGGQHDPPAHTVPAGQQMPPSHTWPLGQQVAVSVPRPMHCVPDGQQTELPPTTHTWLSEQHWWPHTQTSPGLQQVPPQKFTEAGLQNLLGWQMPLMHASPAGHCELEVHPPCERHIPLIHASPGGHCELEVHPVCERHMQATQT